MRSAVILETISEAPLSAEEFDAAVAAFFPSEKPKTVALAISGGPDSMALALLMKDWGQTNNVRLKAFIVDHSLRATSASEAERTRVQLESLAIPAKVLVWEHAPIASRIHILARKARYELLTSACRAEGINSLFLAHQKEDQAETILMRIAKGSGIDGLSGIAAESEQNGIKFLRPFLSFSKERLIATCQAAKITFVSDPSNQSEKFARGRLRRVMPLLADEGLTVERLCDLGARAKDAKEALDYMTGELLRTASDRNLAGVIRIERKALISAPRAIALRALATCLQSIHHEDYGPEQLSLMRLLEELFLPTAMTPRTLHGSLLSLTEKHVIIMREYSVIKSELSVETGDEVIWDGRWQVKLNALPTHKTYTLRSLGNPPHNILDKCAPQLRDLVPQGRARASLPTLWHEENLFLIPSLTTYSGSEPAHAQLLAQWPPAKF